MLLDLLNRKRFYGENNTRKFHLCRLTFPRSSVSRTPRQTHAPFIRAPVFTGVILRSWYCVGEEGHEHVRLNFPASHSGGSGH